MLFDIDLTKIIINKHTYEATRDIKYQMYIR